MFDEAAHAGCRLYSDARMRMMHEFVAIVLDKPASVVYAVLHGLARHAMRQTEDLRKQFVAGRWHYRDTQESKSEDCVCPSCPHVLSKF